MNFDWHMLYPLHTVILDNSRDFRGVPRRAQLCNFSKWFFSPRFGVVPIWELWQFWYVRKGPPKQQAMNERDHQHAAPLEPAGMLTALALLLQHQPPQPQLVPRLPSLASTIAIGLAT